MGKEISVRVNTRQYKADTVRYAAYAVSGEAYVLLEPGKKGEIAVTLAPKPGFAAGALKKRFGVELDDEKMRSVIADSNRELREFMVLKALAVAAAPAADEEVGLTPAQEKELDGLIAQVEREIKKEAAKKKHRDPLGITATWEEKSGPHYERKTKN